ncbi:hypothetical protein RRG08_031751 [Elysia crispata]|uniref:Uncharacterized protein n=1 Tax=Elysia crispata TaxID=231223 RepID=A0AAE0ZF12_9GAST|nr:hypothetical protein RRG08_031751 [Elysia crispata]
MPRARDVTVESINSETIPTLSLNWHRANEENEQICSEGNEKLNGLQNYETLDAIILDKLDCTTGCAQMTQNTAEMVILLAKAHRQSLDFLLQMIIVSSHSLSDLVQLKIKNTGFATLFGRRDTFVLISPCVYRDRKFGLPGSVLRGNRGKNLQTLHCAVLLKDKHCRGIESKQ